MLVLAFSPTPLIRTLGSLSSGDHISKQGPTEPLSRKMTWASNQSQLHRSEVGTSTCSENISTFTAKICCKLQRGKFSLRTVLSQQFTPVSSSCVSYLQMNLHVIYLIKVFLLGGLRPGIHLTSKCCLKPPLSFQGTVVSRPTYLSTVKIWLTYRFKRPFSINFFPQIMTNWFMQLGSPTIIYIVFLFLSEKFSSPKKRTKNSTINTVFSF